MYQVEFFYTQYLKKSDDELSEMVVSPDLFQENAVAAARKILIERGFDIDFLLAEHQKNKDNVLVDYDEEIYGRLERGESLDNVSIIMKDNGFVPLEMVDLKGQNEEEMKRKRRFWGNLAVGFGVTIIILRIILRLARH